MACVSGECTNEYGIPKGVFKDGDGIFYSFGDNHYCWYRNMQQFFCMTGQGENWQWVAELPEFSLSSWSMTYNGPCHLKESCEIIPEGVFKDSDGPAIYYSNGEGHYCGYRNMEHLWCLTGKTGSSKWDWLDERPKYDPEQFPQTIYDGYCYSKKCN
jgi:hypothetical protein